MCPNFSCTDLRSAVCLLVVTTDEAWNSIWDTYILGVHTLLKVEIG